MDNELTIWDRVAPVLFVTFMLTLACGLMGFLIYLDAQSAPSVVETQDNVDGMLVFFAVVGVIGVGIVLDMIARSRYAVPFFVFAIGFALLGGIGYLQLYADKNGDGAQDVQLVESLHPEGIDPQADRMEADTNLTNAQANVTNIGGFVMLAVVFVLVTFALSGAALFLSKE